MYTYISASVMAHQPGSNWSNEDISSMAMSDIYQKFKKIFVTVSNGTSQSIVDLTAARSTYATSLMTLNQVLSSSGSSQLTTVSSVNLTPPKYIRYRDAIASGYHLDCTLMGSAHDPRLPMQMRVDARMNRPKYSTNMEFAHKNCLISVNGYLHMTDTDGDYLYIKDAGRTLQKSRGNKVGIISFKDLGGVTLVPITANMVAKIDPNTLLSDTALLSIDPAIDLKDKTVLLSVGGYLQLPDKTSLYPFNANTFVLKTSLNMYLRRYFESQDFLNLSDLQMPVMQDNPSATDVGRLTSDSVFLKYLTLSQSFFILVNTPKIFTYQYYLKHSTFPGMFISYLEPRFPMIVGNGRIAEYWVKKEPRMFGASDQWSITTVDSYLRNPAFSTTPSPELTAINGALLPAIPFFTSRGFMLEIGTEYN